MLRILGGRRGLSALLMLIVLLTGVALASSCVLNPKDDNGNGKPPIDPDRNRKTTGNLIEKWLPYVYSNMDSTGYEAALDEAYTFELLPGEVDPDDPQGWWDKLEELALTGKMFKARFNSRGEKVDQIKLTLDPKSTVVDNSAERPPGEVWWRVTSFVDLLVTVDDPNDPEGVKNYVVLSDQIFVCRPDPDADSLWVIYKQIDQEPIN
ncbi:MAG: hypothetical protein FJY73_10070 [Candidatus Eisenbacteria bacterium]|nr:hypothetical protein [Candidatus Eisenbacteria bacterium]